MKGFSFFVCSIFILTSCATAYKSINPSQVNYTTRLNENNIDFYYQYGILGLRGNKKFSKKEDKKGFKVISVKITNNTDKTLIVGENLDFYSSDRKLVLLDPVFAHQHLKQGVAIYLLYLPLTFLQFYTYDTKNYNGYSQKKIASSTPIGLLIGPPIVIGNMLVAGTANKRFKEELITYNLNGKKIVSGQTAYGLIIINDFNYGPLNLKTKEF